MKGSAVRIRASAPWKGPLSGSFLASAGGRAEAAGSPGLRSVAVRVEQGLGRELGVEVGGSRPFLDSVLLNRGRAVRADLPQALERPLAAPARVLELRRTDGADEIGVLHYAPADRAVRLDLREPPLEGLDLDLARPRVRESLRRAEEEIDEGSQERHEPEESGRGDEPDVVDAASCVAVHPEREPEPEHRDKEEREVAPDLEAGRMEEIVNRPERRRRRCAVRPGHSPSNAHADDGETPVRSKRLVQCLSR